MRKKKRGKPAKHFVSITYKLFILGLLPLLIANIILSISSSKVLQRSMKEEIQNSLKYIAGSLLETYTYVYPGEYTTNLSGGIYKGSHHVSNDHRLVDSIKKSSGFDCTLYFNGMQIVTTIKRARDGVRAVGIDCDPSIRQSVEFEENTYFSDSVIIEGKRYYGYFAPLYNNTTPCGIVFAGKEYNLVQEQIRAKQKSLMILSIIFILTSVVITMIISTRISKALVYARNYISKIAEGDLTQNADPSQTKRKDEIGQILAKSMSLQAQLKSIITGIKTSSHVIINSSNTVDSTTSEACQTIHEVSTAINGLTQQAKVQAEQTKEASDNIFRMNQEINSIYTAIEELATTTDSMKTTEEDSSKVMSTLKESNQTTTASIDKVVKQTEVTSRSIKNIEKAIVLIQDIAEETDLLSLNASIEAARAGDSGLGFSVVAEEIRKLADQSRASAREIEHIIQELLQESETTDTIMQEVKGNISLQHKYLKQTQDSFQSISCAVGNFMSHTESISDKISRLNSSKDNIIHVIDTLASASMDNAAVSEQTSTCTKGLEQSVNALSATSTSLKDISHKLEEQLSTFKTD